MGSPSPLAKYLVAIPFTSTQNGSTPIDISHPKRTSYTTKATCRTSTEPYDRTSGKEVAFALFQSLYWRQRFRIRRTETIAAIRQLHRSPTLEDLWIHKKRRIQGLRCTAAATHQANARQHQWKPSFAVRRGRLRRLPQCLNVRGGSAVPPDTRSLTPKGSTGNAGCGQTRDAL